MITKKAFLLSVTPLLTALILLIVGITYLWFVKIPELNNAVTKLNSKLESISADVKNKDALNSLLEASLSAATKSQNELENRVKVNETAASVQQQKQAQEQAANEAALSKQQSCNKANELSQIPADLVLRVSGESGGNGCSTSGAGYIPSSTQGALSYLQGFAQNYKDTRREVWQHSPDVCLYDVETALPILETRFADYQKYKNQCDSN